jgi:hypothetical protein
MATDLLNGNDQLVARRMPHKCLIQTRGNKLSTYETVMNSQRSRPSAGITHPLEFETYLALGTQNLEFPPNTTLRETLDRRYPPAVAASLYHRAGHHHGAAQPPHHARERRRARLRRRRVVACVACIYAGFDAGRAGGGPPAHRGFAFHDTGGVVDPCVSSVGREPIRAVRARRSGTRPVGKAARAARVEALGALARSHPAQRLYDRHRYHRNDDSKAARVRRLADLQDQAWHTGRSRHRPRAAQGDGLDLPDRCQYRMDRRSDHLLRPGTQGARRRANWVSNSWWAA